MAKPNVTLERLKELFDFNPDSGVFTRRTFCSNQRAGTVVGSVNSYGYLKVRVDGKAYSVHRLVWLWVSGDWPQAEIDHINGDKQDNRPCNLRDVDRRVNIQNQRKAYKNNKSGLLGARVKGAGRWDAVIAVNKKYIHIGSFRSPEQAHQAYLQAKRVLHEGNTL